MSKLMNKIKNSGPIPLKSTTTKGQLAKEIILIAIFLQVFLEILNHRSLGQGFVTIIHNPLMFICSVSLIASFLSLSLFLPKRHVGYLIVVTLWGWLGFTNFILLSFRTTPITATDFKMISSVFTVIERYVSNVQMILILVLAALVVLSIIVIATKLPYTKIKLRMAVMASGMSVLLFVASFNTAISANAVSTNFGNISDAFRDYGFAYSFSTSVVDKGIKEPKFYSSEKIGSVLESMAMENDHQSTSEVSEQLPEKLVPEMPEIISPEMTLPKVDLAEVKVNTVPNIIVIQLESFFDVKRLKAFEYNQDPTPNITYLQDNYSSGFVTVPSIGAGTVNTEFEILSGMSLDYFGAGEYPYKTILKETTVESLPYDLADLGYQSHAIHNNMGTFYARHHVYPNLGFDSFTSIEYMDDVTYNVLDWAEDKILVPEIIKALDSTISQDFIYAVSVQPHGKYPEEAILEDPVIIPRVASSMPEMINEDSDSETFTAPISEESLESFEEAELPTSNAKFEALSELRKPVKPQEDLEIKDEESLLENELLSIDEGTYNKYLYFVNQVYETDAFIGQLIEELETYPEPLMVVFYGDHLPSLDISMEDLKSGTPYQMDYVIWDNMDLDHSQEDVDAYQMSAMITERLGYNTGLLNRFHQTMKDSPSYQEELQLLQYDMLYGDRNVYGGINPYKKTKMTMGVETIAITDVYQGGEVIFVKGNHFTPFSEVYLNKEKVVTLYIDEHTLIVPNGTLESDMAIKVSQVTDTGVKLGSTSTWKMTEEVEENGDPFIE